MEEAHALPSAARLEGGAILRSRGEPSTAIGRTNRQPTRTLGTVDVCKRSSSCPKQTHDAKWLVARRFCVGDNHAADPEAIFQLVSHGPRLAGQGDRLDLAGRDIPRGQIGRAAVVHGHTIAASARPAISPAAA